MAKRKQNTAVTGRRFRLIDDEGWIGGVCAGIGYYFGVPVWVVRLAWTLALCITGVGILPYILLWIFVPNADRTPPDYEERCG